MFSTNQSSVNTAFSNIKSHVGNFSNRIHFIANTSSTFTTAAGQLVGNELLLSKLSMATGGNLYKYSAAQTINWQTTYSLDLVNILKDLGSLAGYNTSIYNVDLQPTNGFTFSEYPINGYERFSLSSAYVETGKYIGTIEPGSQVNIQVQSPTSTMLSQQKNLVAINAANINNKKSWVYSYIRQLSSTAFTNEIIDSSINNRVLCDYTAFLAIETGDTLKTNVNENQNLKVETAKNNETINVTCAPNPFTDRLTIEWNSDISTIEIYDFSGRKVFTYTAKKGDRKIEWKGTDDNSNRLSSGLYIITLKVENAPPVIIKTLKL